MGQTIYQVDSFTSRAFAGNPAAVCILPAPAPEAWMRDVAREMSLSETAFLVAKGDGFHLRWFTPTVEVELCGHATLAGAHILWETGVLGPNEQARFHTLSGVLTAERKGEWIELDFPAKPEEPAKPWDELGRGLGITPCYVGKSLFDYLVEADSEQTVRNLQPDFTLLKQTKARGVIVTARAEGGEFDFVSRFFAPGAGIDEDPVTGSAHCALGPFWAKKLGKTEFVAYQASARGGVVKVRVVGNRVKLGGQAVTVMRGELV
ncbi:MAG: PhzF family phenazine biosynthesis protein [Terriglobia bacterium]